MAEMPPGAASAFIHSQACASSKKKIIIDNFLGTKHQRFLKTLNQVESLFGQSRDVVFPDHVFGQWITLLNLFEVCEQYSEEAKKQVDGIKDHIRRLDEIHNAAKNLAKLLRQSKLDRQQYGIDADYSLSLDAVIFDAMKKNVVKKDKFDCYIKPSLQKLSRFDDRYWPSIEELIDEVGEQFSASSVKAYLLPPEQIHKKNGFLKAFFDAIRMAIAHKQIGIEILRLSDEDWCWLFNVALKRNDFCKYDINNFKKTHKSLFQIA